MVWIRLSIVAALLTLPACDDDDASTPDIDAGGPDAAGPDAAPEDIAYAEMGSLTQAAGKGKFRFGAASAATQIEDDNPNTDWYWFTLPQAEGGVGRGTFVGDAAKGYTKALEDVALVSDLSLDSYRFSVEWARIEPTRDVYDEEAIAHYRAQLEALVAAGIRPMITVHHFSNPVWIDDPRNIDCVGGPSDTNLCGVGHPEGGPQVVEEMAEFAGKLAAEYGDLVDEWATINEPVNYLLAGNLMGIFPPGRNALDDILGEFVPVVRGFLDAHAAMYKAIKAADVIDADLDGNPADVGLTLSVVEWVAARDNVPSDDPADIAAREKIEWLYHYMVVEGIRQGKFDADFDGELDEDQPDWLGTIDWLGVQYYFRTGVTGETQLILGMTPCFEAIDFGSCLAPLDPSFCVPAMGYEYHAEGLYSVLHTFAQRWPDLPMVVSESGIATKVGERRAANVVRALEQIERARSEGADVRGYYHWSLYDNFEWQEGFEPRFGLYTVDYDTYTRTPTLGADVLGAIAAERRMTGAQRASYGGGGPLAPEPEIAQEFYSCGESRP